MRKEIAEKWAAALRSGKYKQGVHRLANAERTKHCCLGVLCEVAIEDGVPVEVSATREFYQPSAAYDDGATMLPLRVQCWAGMASSHGSLGREMPSLMLRNESGTSFDELADIIEGLWEKL